MAPSWKRRTAAVTTRGRDDPESVWKIPSAARHVRFTAKDHMILLSRNHFITRGDLRRNVTEEESGVGLFWSGSFSCEEMCSNATTTASASSGRGR